MNVFIIYLNLKMGKSKSDYERKLINLAIDL